MAFSNRCPKLLVDDLLCLDPKTSKASLLHLLLQTRFLLVLVSDKASFFHKWVVSLQSVHRKKIPNMFTKRHGAAGLSNPVILKTPDGTEWRVCWTKLNGTEVWLEKGWKEFAEHYSLEYGYLVLFKYEGTSVFDVVILDQSALEIDYPSCDENGDNLDQSDHESVDIWPNRKARQSSPLFPPRPHKKIRGEKTGQRTSSSLNWPRGARAQEIAQKFISDNPFFTVSINPAIVTRQLSVPDFKGVIENKEKYVMLQIGKRSWKVKLLPYHRQKTRRLSAGWPLFASESELQPGDVCVFELINRQNPVFQVHVFERPT